MPPVISLVLQLFFREGGGGQLCTDAEVRPRGRCGTVLTWWSGRRRAPLRKRARGPCPCLCLCRQSASVISSFQSPATKLVGNFSCPELLVRPGFFIGPSPEPPAPSQCLYPPNTPSSHQSKATKRTFGPLNLAVALLSVSNVNTTKCSELAVNQRHSS